MHGTRFTLGTTITHPCYKIIDRHVARSPFFCSSTYLSFLTTPIFFLLFTERTLHSDKVMTVHSTLLSSHACTFQSSCCGFNNKTRNIITKCFLKYFIIFHFEPTNIFKNSFSLTKLFFTYPLEYLFELETIARSDIFQIIHKRLLLVCTLNNFVLRRQKCIGTSLEI